MGPLRGGNPPNGNGCANRQSISHSSDDREQVQTARIDYNIDAKNIAWFRFQSDTGLQAAYTDPINPLFNAISPQPLYSFAAGYTHVFSGHLVNYFNPAFSWYESLFGPADFQKTLAAFPIVLQGSGANAPFTTLGGLDNTWVQGRRATRFFINDNLAWTVGSHEFRFGTNSRIFRLNDYDFGEGVVPLVTYTTLPQFIYGVASTASKTFPLANSQPYNFLNLDFYAQDTWKVTRDVDLDLRHPRYVQFKSSESAQRRGAPRRVVRFHFPRCESAAEPGHSDAAGDDFRRHARRDPAAQNRHRLADRAAHGAAQRVRPVQRHPAGQRRRSRGNESSLLEDLSGRTAGHGGGSGDCAGSSEQRHRCDCGGESAIQLRASRKASFPAPRPGESKYLPSADFDHRRSGWQAPCALLHAVEFCRGAPDRQRTQSASSICRHARGEPALRDASERLSDGLRGMLRAVPIRAAERSALRAGDAIEHRREQPLQRSPVDGRQAAGARHSGPGQLHVEPLHGHGLKRRIPAIRRRSHSFAAAGRAWPPIRPLRLRRAAQLHGPVRLSVADQIPESHAGPSAERMAGLRHRVLA